MTKPDHDLQIGFISPLREYLRREDKPKRKRNPIGFVHFGEPEEEPRSYLDEYIQFIMEGEEHDDELHVGFTAPVDDII
jgi:hypothetical protein